MKKRVLIAFFGVYMLSCHLFCQQDKISGRIKISKTAELLDCTVLLYCCIKNNITMCGY